MSKHRRQGVEPDAPTGAAPTEPDDTYADPADDVDLAADLPAFPSGQGWLSTTPPAGSVVETLLAAEAQPVFVDEHVGVAPPVWAVAAPAVDPPPPVESSTDAAPRTDALQPDPLRAAAAVPATAFAAAAADERDHAAADERDHAAADERDHAAADERDHAADERDHAAADERDHAAADPVQTAPGQDVPVEVEPAAPEARAPAQPPAGPARPRALADDPDALRRANAAARDRQRRRRRGLAALAGALVLVLVVVGVVLLDGGSKKPAPVAAAGTTQRTALVVLGDPGGTAQVVGIEGIDQASRKTVLALLPTRLQVSPTGGVPGALSQVGGQDLRLVGSAVGDATGVRVDGGWRLSPAGLAALVDAVGGITVDVDADVPDPADPAQAVAQPGKGQHLGGTAAAAYATLLLPSEDEVARIARFTTVVMALVAALPGGTQPLTALVSRLGTASTATAGTDPVALLQALKAAPDQQTEPLVKVVTTTSVDLGAGSTPLARLEPQQVQDLQTNTFPGASLPQAQSGVRVFVLVGAGSPDALLAVRSRLLDAGLLYVGARNDEGGLTRTQTLVLVPADDAAARVRGAAVAAALGLDPSHLRVTSDATSIADVTVKLGSDVTDAVAATPAPAAS